MFPWAQKVEERVTAECGQRLTDIRLKNNDDSDSDDGQEVLQQPGHGLQLKPIGDVIKQDDKDYAESNSAAAGSLDEVKDVIDEDRDEDNIYQGSEG